LPGVRAGGANAPVGNGGFMAVSRNCVLVAVMLAASTAHAEMWVEPAFPKEALKGPAASEGAFVWSHGAGGIYLTDNSTFGPPIMAYLMRNKGWDVFSFKRTVAAEAPLQEARELVQQVAALKQKGYRRIVLGGQSAGAWISLMAAGNSADIHAVIALSPAHYGTDRPYVGMNASALYGYLDDIKTARVMIAFFKDDPYDPGGRGPRAEQILSSHNVPHLVIDQPAGFSGHGSGESGLFYRRFSDCWLAVAGDGPMPRRQDCESHWGDAPSGEIALPAVAKASALATGPIAAFQGTWWGTYTVGREVALVVKPAPDGRAEVTYMVGAMPADTAKAETSMRSGSVVNGVLEIAESGKSTLRLRPRPDRDLDLEWLAATGSGRLTTVVHRVAQ
jgi:dienelactone hydrolase